MIDSELAFKKLGFMGRFQIVSFLHVVHLCQSLICEDKLHHKYTSRNGCDFGGFKQSLYKQNMYAAFLLPYSML